MSTVINLDDARARGIDLPVDDGVAQDILDEQEAWLIREIGALTGSRTERFYVGYDASGKIGLTRYTDSVTLTDGGVSVDTDYFRLIDRGAAVYRTTTAPSRFWTGPYIDATYTPNDEDVVRSSLYDLVALAAEPASRYNSERIGDYSYSRNRDSTAAQRAAIVARILPKRDSLTSVYIAPRRLVTEDPVVNRPEVWP